MIEAAKYTQQPADVYTDLASVQSIRALKDKSQALRQVAEQFESMMLRMMMKSMRSANEAFAEGNYLNSHEANTYRDMLDDQMSLNLVKGRGLGIADVMVRQLQGRFGVAATADATSMQALPERRSFAPVTMPAVAARSADVPMRAAGRQTQAMSFDGSIQQFVDRLYPMAEQAGKELGVSPMVLIAQSALETGWGKKMTAHHNGEPSLNFFNIKANRHWQGESVTVPTLEIRNGLPVKELGEFRAYNSAQDSFTDYVNFVKNSTRYEKACASEDAESYIRALAEGGYATDTHYADKVIRIMNSDELKAAVTSAAENLPENAAGES